jgi:benzoate membrane transport protein
MISQLNSKIISSFSSIKNDFSISAISVSLIAAMVAFAGPILIIFQAAQAAHLSDPLLSSWIWSISFGTGLTSLILSMYFKAPVITAWSTPGVVMLVSGWSAYSYSDAIGAFLLSAIMITILGFSGLFSYVMKKVPQSVTTAMLAGILLKFGVDIFVSLKQLPILVIPMLLCYLVCKRWSPRYSVLFTLLVGLVIAYSSHKLNFNSVHITLIHPIFTKPTFSIAAFIGLAIPLSIVATASQNAPGIGVLRADGYNTPANPLIATTGIASILLAPFGCHGLNLAAITAAICTGKEAHPDPSKRYIAGIACGVIYPVLGLFGATIASAISAFPKELTAAIAGLALFVSLSSNLSSAMAGSEKESALITFLVTISGISIFGVGSAFWGLIAGLATNFILTVDMRKIFSAKKL